MAEAKKKMDDRNLDEELIRKLADLLRETGLNELEIETDGLRVRASLGGTHVVAAPATPMAANQSQAVEAAKAEIPMEDHPGTVKSPMVGTAYIAPEPTAPSFVQVGDTVQMGQTLMIIEAMKVMNPIPAPQAGVVKQILVKDSQPVEFGDPLLIIE